MFISILYMLRAAMLPSSGELLYQCDTWFMSLCVDDRLVCTQLFFFTDTCEIKSWIAMAKAAFNKKKNFLPANWT